MVTIIVFILGCFLDFFEIAFIMVPLLAPAAEKLGIDLIWFGIILGINLQTSFLTPPFGFSLFYLRSIAPASEWRDAVTGRLMPRVRTTEIYKGAVPYIVIQVLVILLVIAFPGLVTHYKSASTVDPATIDIEIPGFGGQGLGGPPSMGLPPLGSPPPAGQPPAEQPAPAAPAAPDLSQPPKFN